MSWKSQEWQQNHNEQLDEFQEIGAKLCVKTVVTLHAIHEGNKEVTKKMVEHPLKQDFFASQEISKRIQVQVKEITQ